MKTNQLLGAALAFIALVSSCKKDDYRKLEKGNPSEVQFTSKIVGNQLTKASGTSWDANDEIGVYMKQGVGLNNALASNKKYVTQGNGNFTASGSDLINYPETGAVDFIAYYPYSASLEGTSLGINVSNQSSQAAIDVMYSDNAKNLDKNSGSPKLEFVHKLSKIELLVKAGTGVSSLSGLAVSYQAIPTVSSLDLGTGAISAGTSPANVSAKVAAQNTDQLVEAILIPGEYGAKEVIFSIGADTYKWALPGDSKYESGKKYSYNITLQVGGAVKVEGTATITDWTSVAGGSYTIEKDKGTVTPPVTEGKEETVYEETFGDPTEDVTRVRIADYKYFLNKTVQYSDLYTDSYVDIRKTSTIGMHVWMPANRTTGIKIENVNATGYSNLKLSYSLAANGSEQPIGVVKVKVNGQEMTTTPNGNLGAQHEFTTIQVNSAVPTGNLTIEFSADASVNKAGYRLDNIKLLGTK